MASFTIHFVENGTNKKETVNNVSSKYEAINIVRDNHPNGTNFH